MRRPVRRPDSVFRAPHSALIAGGLVFLGAAFVLATLPPRATVLDPPAASGRAGTHVVAGAFHVHSNRSDGTGSVDEIASAAARAELKFVILADHGDGTEPPLVPGYRHGVLMLAGVEISTTGGHYIALGLPPAPYPLGGAPRDVVEDVARLGGVGIAAHPGSPKAELAWRDWDLPFDGLEWLNADSEWRDDGYGSLARLAFQYPLRPAEALASLLDRPNAVLARWDERTRVRRAPALAGADAHARLGARGETSNVLPGFSRADKERRASRALLKVPSYEASFRAFAIRLVLDSPLSGHAVADASRVVDAVRGGRVYTAIDALARPAAFDFSAEGAGGTAKQGDILPATGSVTLRARANAPPESRIVLLRHGHVVREATGGTLEYVVDAPRAAYRVEVRVPGAPGEPPVPWIVSNPIYVGGPWPAAASTRSRRAAERSVALGSGRDVWTIERHAETLGELDHPPAGDPDALVFWFILGKGRPAGQYAALARTLPDGARGFDRIRFRARADRPMRLSVQLRERGSPGTRWRRSVYIDAAERDLTVFLDDMTAIGESGTQALDAGRVRSLLFVVDTTNTLPGTRGIVRVDDVRLEGR